MGLILQGAALGSAQAERSVNTEFTELPKKIEVGLALSVLSGLYYVLHIKVSSAVV